MKTVFYLIIEYYLDVEIVSALTSQETYLFKTFFARRYL